MRNTVLFILLFICVAIISVIAQSQSQNVTRFRSSRQISRQRAPAAQQLSSISQQRRGGETRRRPLVQLIRSSSQIRPSTNRRSFRRTQSTIPRARSFQAGLPNIRPTRADPRITSRQRTIPERRQRITRIIPGSRTQTRSINRNPISTMCARPRSIRCFSWPRNRDQREAYICDGGCVGRTCPIPCECSCVDPRLIGRLRAIGRISGPELILIDNRLTDSIRQQQMRNRLLSIRASRSRGGQTGRGVNPNNPIRSSNAPQQNSSTTDLSFGISDEVLATLIAQPVLNEIVGPQGINQILAGEPPQLLSRDERRQSVPGSSLRGNTVTQPEIRTVGTPFTRAQQPNTEFPTRVQNMGIPVPLSRLNFDPIRGSDPSLGNMRVMMSDVRPFQDATSGLQLDLPSPTPVDSGVSVRQLPGTNVLFVDLTRSPNLQSSNTGAQGLSALPTTFGNPRSRNLPTLAANMTSANIRSSSQNILLNPGFNQTLPGSAGREFGGRLQTFVDGAVTATDPLLRAPTQDECLAQRLELWCDPQQPWEGTPGLPRWCLLNCRADNCDNQRCACACIEEIIFKARYEQLALNDPPQ